MDAAAATQFAQMQASPRASAGTRARRASLKSADMHQQGGCDSPVSRATSIAHALAAPQSGQRVGSGEVGAAEDMAAF